MTLTQAKQKLLRLDPQTALNSAIEQTKEQYIALNESQWAEGKLDNSADIIPTPYSQPYAKKRRTKGLQTAFIDLKYSGALYNGYEIEIVDGKMILKSSVAYEKYVTGRYGVMIWGLTPENMAKYRAIVKPLVLAATKAQWNA